jgi:hypothetical protein
LLSFLNTYASNTHSQNGEDGILAESVARLGLQSGHAVEIGGNDGHWMSNTRLLLESGWSGLFVEADYGLYLKSKANWANNPRVRSQCARVDERNINIFVGERCDLLSLDTDGSDYLIFAGLNAKPKIVIMEIDSGIPPNVQGFNSDGAAGYFSGVELGLEKGYFLLCHTGNLVFIKEEYKHLFPEVKSRHPLNDSEYYFNRAWLKEEAA